MTALIIKSSRDSKTEFECTGNSTLQLTDPAADVVFTCAHLAAHHAGIAIYINTKLVHNFPITVVSKTFTTSLLVFPMRVVFFSFESIVALVVGPSADAIVGTARTRTGPRTT